MVDEILKEMSPQFAKLYPDVGRHRIFLAYLRLGCTAFGGPIAHLGYFHDEFVVRCKWVEEATFTDIVGLCQFLPGPASSQVGFTVGILRGGFWGALTAWTAFTLPSALLMFAVASGHGLFSSSVGSGVVHALQRVAVAVIAQAVWTMIRTLTPVPPGCRWPSFRTVRLHCT
jgi:chromate transporter